MEPFPKIPEWITLEHQVAQILTQQEQHGWYFDEQAAVSYTHLTLPTNREV